MATEDPRITALREKGTARRSQVGHLEVVFGPMYAEKSTALMLDGIRKVRRGVKVLVLQHSINTRDSGLNGIVTHHGGKLLKGEHVDYVQLSEAPVFSAEVYGKYGAFLVEEGQFWPSEIAQFCMDAADSGARVTVAALSGDKDQAPWPTVSILVAKADSVRHLLAECEFCLSPAPFTICTKDFKEVIHPGSTPYVPVCRECLSVWRKLNGN